MTVLVVCRGYSLPSPPPFPPIKTYLATHPPELQHVQQQRYLHEVDPPADVVVPEHDQALAQLQAGLLQQVGLPVALQDPLQDGGVNLRRVLEHELAQKGAALSLSHKI